ncbi:hypothetical protein [Bacteroides sp.]|uniref:hypothetical protein n=1 Tax=Bacteroides sp. TaxID=29523 RepID=UPI0026256BDE|nr:hypothetical protein [Bacteroides sp.]
METKSLRIRNLVKYKLELVEVNSVCPLGITIEGFASKTDNPNNPTTARIIPKEDIHSIPLSEQLLFDIGLIPTKEDGYKLYYLPNRRVTFFVVEEDGLFYMGMTDLERPRRITIQGLTSIHELQNAYFTIYGEELLS